MHPRRPPFPLSLSSFAFPFASSSSPSSHLLSLYLSLPPRTGLGPFTSIPFHCLLVAGTPPLSGSDRPWLWRPANPKSCPSEPYALSGRSSLACIHRPHMHPARGTHPVCESRMIADLVSIWVSLRWFSRGVGVLLVVSGGDSVFRFLRRGLGSGTWRRERERERGRIAVGWDVLFGIVRLDSVKFGRFGLPEWDIFD